MTAIERARHFGARRFVTGFGFACAVALSIPSSALAAPTRGVSLDSANRAFGAGQYVEAASDFEQLIAQRGYSAPLLFNLGNAYLKGGNPVRALLAYERAEQLAPGDEAIAANLSQARGAASAPDPRGRVSSLVAAWSLNTWAWLASAGLFSAAAAGAAYSLWRRGRRWSVCAAACGATLFATALSAVLVESKALERALVLESTPVLVSPFDSAQSDFALTPGSDVQLIRTRDQFAFIRDARGHSGWVERARIEPVIPGAP